MQSKHKQIVNIADENLMDYSFLSRYRYTKSKNFFKKTISNSSLNSHVYWDTLYLTEIWSIYLSNITFQWHEAEL